jgi:hypothetical protein
LEFEEPVGGANDVDCDLWKNELCPEETKIEVLRICLGNPLN